jgi:Zn-dependent protease with chaperone function
MLILVLLAWPARRLLGAWILLAVLAFFQAILASSGYHHWGLGMFHPVNAIILLGLSGRLAHYAWTSRKSEEAAPAPAAMPSG